MHKFMMQCSMLNTRCSFHMLCFNKKLTEPSVENCWLILDAARIGDARVGDEKVCRGGGGGGVGQGKGRDCSVFNDHH